MKDLFFRHSSFLVRYWIFLFYYLFPSLAFASTCRNKFLVCEISSCGIPAKASVNTLSATFSTGSRTCLPVFVKLILSARRSLRSAVRATNSSRSMRSSRPVMVDGSSPAFYHVYELYVYEILSRVNSNFLAILREHPKS